MPTQAEIDALAAAALANAAQPKSAVVDGNSVTNRDAKDAADAIALASQQGIDVRQLFGNRTRLVPGPRQ